MHQLECSVPFTISNPADPMIQSAAFLTNAIVKRPDHPFSETRIPCKSAKAAPMPRPRSSLSQLKCSLKLWIVLGLRMQVGKQRLGFTTRQMPHPVEVLLLEMVQDLQRLFLAILLVLLLWLDCLVETGGVANQKNLGVFVV